MSGGKILLDRAIRGHWIWNEKPFNRAQAWIDILMAVNWKPGRTVIKGQLVEVGRGQSALSLDSWGERWGWNKSKVQRFFALLEKDGMIETENVKVTTRLTVCNYDRYQTFRYADDTQGETQTQRTRYGDDTQAIPIEEGNTRNEGCKGDSEISRNNLGTAKGGDTRHPSASTPNGRPVFPARVFLSPGECIDVLNREDGRYPYREDVKHVCEVYFSHYLRKFGSPHPPIETTSFADTCRAICDGLDENLQRLDECFSGDPLEAIVRHHLWHDESWANLVAAYERDPEHERRRDYKLQGLSIGGGDRIRILVENSRVCVDCGVSFENDIQAVA